MAHAQTRRGRLRPNGSAPRISRNTSDPTTVDHQLDDNTEPPPVQGVFTPVNVECPVCEGPLVPAAKGRLYCAGCDIETTPTAGKGVDRG